MIWQARKYFFDLLIILLVMKVVLRHHIGSSAKLLSLILKILISDRSQPWARSFWTIVEKRELSVQKTAWSYDKKSWLSRNILSYIRNLLKHVRLYHIASGNREKLGKKWLTRPRAILKRSPNFDEIETDLSFRVSESFKDIWKRRPRWAYISNFIKIGQCAPFLPCAHLLSLFQ